MAHARISAKLPPNVDPTKAPIAFGERALPKLNEELRDPVLITRQRALMALCDLVHDPEIAYKAISTGCLENLKRLLQDKDSTVRQKTTEVLYLLATHSVGRYGFLQSGVIVPLSKLFDEPVDLCRLNMHRALEMMSELPAGAAGIVQAGLIPRLVLKLHSELEEIEELILDTLHFCLRVDAMQALGAGAVSVLKDKLSHTSVAIRWKAARALMVISVPLEGKNKVCEEEVIPLLVNLLSDPEPKVQANAAGALMTATITTKGKYAALHASAIPPLLQLVKSPVSEVRLNVLKAITTLAEAPPGRTELLNHVNQLAELMADPKEAVQRAANIAVRVISWKP